MNTPRRFAATLLVSLLLTLTAMAGDMDTPKAPPPQPVTIAEVEPIQETDNTNELESIADYTYELLETVLSLF